MNEEDRDRLGVGIPAGAIIEQELTGMRSGGAEELRALALHIQPAVRREILLAEERPEISPALHANPSVLDP
jgi:hypothetical protein